MGVSLSTRVVLTHTMPRPSAVAKKAQDEQEFMRRQLETFHHFVATTMMIMSQMMGEYERAGRIAADLGRGRGRGGRGRGGRARGGARGVGLRGRGGGGRGRAFGPAVADTDADSDDSSEMVILPLPSQQGPPPPPPPPGSSCSSSGNSTKRASGTGGGGRCHNAKMAKNDSDDSKGRGHSKGSDAKKKMDSTEAA